MHHDEDAAYYRRREKQEESNSERCADPMISRLHWEMSQQYARRAQLLEARASTPDSG